MTTNISGPFGNYNYATPGGVLNALCAEGVPLNTVERVTVSFTGNHGGEIKDGKELFATFKVFPAMNRVLFMFRKHDYSQQSAMWGHDKKLRPKFKLCLYVHDQPGLIVRADRDKNLFTKELHEFITMFIRADISHINENSPDWMKKNHEMYNVRQAAGAFFQGGHGSHDKEWFYIEFWKPEGAQAFVDYVNENFVYEGRVQPPMDQSGY